MSELPTPALQQVNGVLLQGQALVDAAHLVAAGLRSARREDGISASPRLRRLADTLASAAAMSACGRADVRPDAGSASLLADDITVTEAAQMLEVSTRQARRVLPTLGGRRTSAGWLIQRGAVVAHLHERSTEA